MVHGNGRKIPLSYVASRATMVCLVFLASLRVYAQSNSDLSKEAEDTFRQATILKRQLDVDEALKQYQKALSLFEQASGPKSPNTLLVMYVIGKEMRELRRDDVAAEHFREIIARTDLSRDNEVDSIRVASLWELGIIHLRKNEHADASTRLQEALRLYKSIERPESSIDYLRLLFDSSSASIAIRDYGSAQRELSEAWLTYQVDDRDDLETARRIAERLILVKLRLGDSASAVAIAGEYLRITRNKFASDSAELVEPLRWLGVAYGRADKLVASEKCLTEALAIVEKTGNDPFVGCDVRRDLAALYASQGRDDRAEGYARESVECLLKVSNSQKLAIERARLILAEILILRGKLDEAEEELTKCRDASDLNRFQEALTSALLKVYRGDLRGGRTLLTETVAIASSKFGVESEEYRAALVDLIRLRIMLAEYKDAIRLIDQATDAVPMRSLDKAILAALRAEALMHEGDLPAAAQAINGAVDTLGEVKAVAILVPRIRTIHARICAALGQFDEAEISLKISSEMLSEHFATRIPELVDVQLASGQLSLSRGAYERPA